MRSIISKLACVAVVAVLAGALSGCCTSCEDGWGHYKECDILDGTYTTNWPGCKNTQRPVCRPYGK